MDLFLRENHLLRCWGWLSLLNWIGVLTLSLLLKLPPRKLEPWFILWNFFLLRLLCISINLPCSCMEYCFHVSAGAPNCYLELFDKLQKQICRAVCLSLTASLAPMAHCWNVASLSLFYRCYFGRCSTVLAQLVPLPCFYGRFSRYCLVFLSPFLNNYKDVYVNSFFPCIVRLRNSIPIECLPLTYDLNG